MKKVVVTGAAGYIGQHLIPVLINNNYQPLAITRKNGSMLLHRFSINVKEKEQLTYEDKADLVINLAYAQSPNVKMNAAQNAEIIDTIQRVTHPKTKIIHLSSLAVFGYVPDSKQAPEALNLHNDFSYVASKLQIERLLLSNFTGNEIHMVRAGHVWGPGSGWANTMAQVLFYQFPVLHTGKTFSNTTAIGNLCDYILFLCKNESSQFFHHVAENYFVSWEELLKPMARLMQVQMQPLDNIPHYPTTKLDELKHMVKLNPATTLRLAARSRFYSKYAQGIIEHIPSTFKQLLQQKVVPENPVTPLAKWLLSCEVPFIHQADKRWIPPVSAQQSLVEMNNWLEESGYVIR